MGLSLTNLDDKTRRFMVEEIEMDIASGNLYFSKRFTEGGRAAYPSLLREAAQSQTDDWLAAQIQARGLLVQREQKHKPKGGYTWVDVPYNAHETYAEGEFNRFYARGLCRRAIDEGIAELVIYRAKEVVQPRSASFAKIGTKIKAEALLQDLRTHPGVDTALGLPSGPNSGLSVRLP